MAFERKVHVNNKEKGVNADQSGDRTVVCGGRVERRVRLEGGATSEGEDAVPGLRAESSQRPHPGYDATGAGQAGRTHTPRSVALHTHTPAHPHALPAQCPSTPVTSSACPSLDPPA